MAKDKKLKASKNKVVEDKIVTQSQSTSSTTEKKTKDSKKQETPPPDDDNSNSPVTDEEEREVDDEEEDDEDEKEDGDEEDDEDKKADHLSWPKSDDLELFKQIRRACPKGDTMRYSSRVNNLDWELVTFQDYSADQCRNRWLHIQAHLRHYRILSDLLEDALSWVDNPWYDFNKGAKNKQKHPEQPKKPLTSYMLYFIEQKEAVMEKEPNLGMAELSKVIANMYNGLSDQKKTKYLELARKHMEDYQEKMKKFMDAHPDYVPPKSKYAKAVAPRPPTPFNLFSDEKMEELLAEGVMLSDARERCRDAYKELKDIEKLSWIHRAIEQEHNYDEEFKKFQFKNPDCSAKQPNLLTREELRIKHESMGKPKNPPNSGYSLFSQQGLTRKEAMTEIGMKWKELNDEKKALYSLKAAEMNMAYKKKYASYIARLTPEQRRAELIDSRGQKRKQSAAGLKGDEKVMRKKAKCSAAADAGSSDKESENNGASDEDFEIFPKTDILKERKVNGQTVQKSMNEMPSTSKKSSASTSSKADVKSTATALKSPERDSSSKKSAGNSDSKSLKLSPKSSRPASSVKSSKEPKTPVWAANQVLYEAEPPKPPGSVVAYYVVTHHSQAGDLSSADIDILWDKVSEKQKKKLMSEYDKIQNDYEQDFENFARTLEKDELKAFRVFIKKREQNDEDGEGGSYGSTDEGDGSSEGSDEDSEPNGSNEEEPTSGASSDEEIKILHESIKLE